MKISKQEEHIWTAVLVAIIQAEGRASNREDGIRGAVVRAAIGADVAVLEYRDRLEIEPRPDWEKNLTVGRR